MFAAAPASCPFNATATAPRRRFATIARSDPRRMQVERFIGGVYGRQYGARIDRWAPTLVTLCTDGRLAAAAGYRRAIEPLFLERYLGLPVEDAIAAQAGHRVARRNIVEVGHFVSTLPGEGRRLLLALARHLAGQGCHWVVSTATRELRVLLTRMGLRPFALAPANPRCLGDEAADWGRYYDHAPVVVAGDLAGSLATLERRLMAPSTRCSRDFARVGSACLC